MNPRSALRDLSEAELNALLDGIAARYSLTREQLSAQQDQIGLLARTVEAQLDIARRNAVRGAREAALERGVLRSGLHARNVAAIDTSIAQQGQQAAASRQVQQDAISTALARLGRQSAQEQAQARQAVEQGLLQFEQGQTVADLLASLPPAPATVAGPLLSAAPNLTNPLLPSQPGNATLFGAQYATPYNYGVQPTYASDGPVAPSLATASGRGITTADIEAWLRARGVV